MCEICSKLTIKHQNDVIDLGNISRVEFIYIRAEDIYLSKVNNENNRKMSEICSKLTIKSPEQRH